MNSPIHRLELPRARPASIHFFLAPSVVPVVSLALSRTRLCMHAGQFFEMVDCRCKSLCHNALRLNSWYAVMQLMQNAHITVAPRPRLQRCSRRSSKLTSSPFPWYYQKVIARTESLCLSAIRWSTKLTQRISEATLAVRPIWQSHSAPSPKLQAACQLTAVLFTHQPDSPASRLLVLRLCLGTRVPEAPPRFPLGHCVHALRTRRAS